MLQVFFLVVCCYPPDLRNTGSAWFLVLCLVGAVLGGFVLFHNRPGNFAVYPELKVDAELITSGPYRYLRHPMYSALMLMMVGVAGYNGHWSNWAAAAGLVAVVTIKALREEELLRQAFPRYADYAGPIKRFLPGVY